VWVFQFVCLFSIEQLFLSVTATNTHVCAVVFSLASEESSSKSKALLVSLVGWFSTDQLYVSVILTNTHVSEFLSTLLAACSGRHCIKNKPLAHSSGFFLMQFRISSNC